MLFQDGNRIDLHIQTKEAMHQEYGKDSLTVPLLDKDQILPQIGPSSDRGYWIQKPTESRYLGCCNEFWWCMNNVAKGIVRDQFPYAIRMYHEVVHVELDKMLEWYIGIKTEFSDSAGMWGKYFKKYLPSELYELYLGTYSDCETLWTAVFSACELFHMVASVVGKHCEYEYYQNDEDHMMRYLEIMRNHNR